MLPRHYLLQIIVMFVNFVYTTLHLGQLDGTLKNTGIYFREIP